MPAREDLLDDVAVHLGLLADDEERRLRLGASSASRTSRVYTGSGPSSNVSTTPFASRGPRTIASTKIRSRSTKTPHSSSAKYERRAREQTDSDGGSVEHGAHGERDPGDGRRVEDDARGRHARRLA